MRKLLAIGMAVGMVAGLVSLASAHGRWDRGQGNWEADDRDYGRGRHMYGREAGRGKGYGPGYCRNGYDRERSGEVDKAETAAEIVTRHLERSGNPNLKVGKVTEAGRDFEVEIVTQDGSLANKLLVEKRSGRVLSAYRY